MSESAAPISRALARLKNLVDAGRPLIYVHSPEEARVLQLAQEAAQRLFPHPVPVYTWTVTDGLRGPDGVAVPATTDGRAALDHILSHHGAALFVLRDFHAELHDSEGVRRRMRDLYAACLDSGKFIVISSPVAFVPDELTRDLVVIDLPLPDPRRRAPSSRRGARWLSAASPSTPTPAPSPSSAARCRA
ncbi:MAG: hypothetical protein U0802_16440 [Candidatus Binatia bacterium]